MNLRFLRRNPARPPSLKSDMACLSPMQEELAQEIISEYLADLWKVKPRRRASGPDFLHEGNAIEVKGSDFRWQDHVGQFTKYVHEYASVGLAFPTDALDAWNLTQMHVFTLLSFESFGKYVAVYLITDSEILRDVPYVHPVQRESKFGILKNDYAYNLFDDVMSNLKSNVKLKELKDVKRKMEEVESLSRAIDDKLKEATLSYVVQNGATKWISPPSEGGTS